MPVQKLKEFLDKNHTKYVSIVHSPAYTAQDVAEYAHISGKYLAKTVIIKLNGKLAMVILPATLNVNFEHLEKELGTKPIELASEHEFKDRFNGCELGAIPPFGNLFNMDVFVENQLCKDKKIAFSAGNYSELIQMEYQDFERLVKPKVINM